MIDFVIIIVLFIFCIFSFSKKRKNKCAGCHKHCIYAKEKISLYDAYKKDQKQKNKKKNFYKDHGV